jgi:GNAT superfamily N-acetyltransferase
MTPTITIRKLNEDHAEAWAALRREALATEPLVFGQAAPADPAELVQFIRARLREPEVAVFGAFAEDTIVGIVGIRRNIGVKERHKVSVWGMYVTPANRRSGVGEKLIQASIELARSWTGVEQVHLAVSETAKEARRLYERMGFHEWGVEPRALCWQGRCVDEAHMTLRL